MVRWLLSSLLVLKTLVQEAETELFLAAKNKTKCLTKA